MLSQDYCGEYKQHVSDRKLSSGIQRVYERYSELIEGVARFFNTSVQKAQSLAVTVLGSIISNEFEGFDYPGVFDQKWKEAAGGMYVELKRYERYHDEHLAKFAASEFFLEVISQFEGKVSGSLGRKATIYSAHDTSIMNIFATLGVRLTEQPPFASLVVFELLGEGGKEYVKIIYNGEAVRIPMLPEMCELGQFKEYIYSRIFSDVQQACRDIALLMPLFMPLESGYESGSGRESIEGNSAGSPDEEMITVVAINGVVMVAALIIIFIIVKKNISRR